MPDDPKTVHLLHGDPHGGWRPPVHNMAVLATERLRTHGHQPFVTYYDDVGGERTELSYATFDNWVSKTANLLVEELELGAGDRVAVALDGHWTAPIVVFSCWKAGLSAACATDSADALPLRTAAVFRHEDLPADAAAAGDLESPTLAVGSAMAGRPSRPTTDDYVYAEEVLAFADDYDDPSVAAAAEALLVADSGPWLRWTQSQLFAAGEALAGWGLTEDDRVLCGTPLDRADSVVVWAAAFLAGASVVAVRHADPATFWRKVTDERVTWAMLTSGQLDAVLAGGRPPAGTGEFRGFLSPRGASAAAVAKVAEELGVVLCAGDDLPAATYASSLLPADVDQATLRWLGERDGRPAGAITSRADVEVRDGEICVRGPVVMAGADEDGMEMFEDGWLHTGRPGVVAEGPDARRHVFVI